MKCQLCDEKLLPQDFNVCEDCWQSFDSLYKELEEENEQYRKLLKSWMKRAEQYDPHWNNELYLDTQTVLSERTPKKEEKK